jgi:hypothetical protein
VRRIDRNGMVTTVAGGTGVLRAAGDGGPATTAQLNAPVTVAVDRQGNLSIPDPDNFRSRKVNSAGTITTVAGRTTRSSPEIEVRQRPRPPALPSTRATTSTSPTTPPCARSTALGASPPSPAGRSPRGQALRHTAVRPSCRRSEQRSYDRERFRALSGEPDA